MSGNPSDSAVSIVSQVPLFAGAPLDLLAEICVGSQTTNYIAGQPISIPGQPIGGLGVLVNGQVSLHLIDAAAGQKIAVETLLQGDVFGVEEVLTNPNQRLAVLAVDPSQILFLKLDAVRAGLLKSPPLSLRLAQSVTTRLQQLGSVALQETAGHGGQIRASTLEGRVPLVEIGGYEITPALLGIIPHQAMRKQRMLPLRYYDGILTIGMVNPYVVEARAELQQLLPNVRIELVAVSQGDFDQACVRHRIEARAAGPSNPKAAAKNRTPRVTYVVEQAAGERQQTVIGDEVVALVDKLLIEAAEVNASDVHIEPEVDYLSVRYRVSGSLNDREGEQIPGKFSAPLIARIKVLAQLDVTERRQPQDGRIAASIEGKELNVRVSVIPTSRGQKAVLRLIDTAAAMRPLRQVFLTPGIAEGVNNALSEPYGAIVVAGPTGSGKSSSLYSMLTERRRAREDMSIVTVEDPVEYELEKITQVPVTTQLGFAAILRGILRQDPDVIMIGELRDRETATIMVEAALTGHLVLTSMHGNDANAVIQRLQHLGSDRVLLSQALSTIIVQRLTRRLCSSCVTLSPVQPSVIQHLATRGIIFPPGTTQLPRPVGCDACQRSGFTGRVAVPEMFQFDDLLRAALSSGATPGELVKKARERNRFVSFADSAAHLMAQRILDPNDALYVVASG